MKPEVARAVAQLAGPGVEVAHWRPVGGGSINAAWWLDLSDGRSRFVKTHPAPPPEMFEREAEGLAALAAVGFLRVPKEVRVGEAAGTRFLAMEAVASGRPGVEFFADFGRRLAEQHRVSAGARYGFDKDNYIGSTPQPNPWTDDWVEFFARHRLGFQLNLATRRGLADRELRRLGERLIGRLSDWLAGTGEPPCLLRVLDDLGVGHGCVILFGKQAAIGAVDLRDLIGDALRIEDQPVDLTQRGLQVAGNGGREAREVLRLVDQHLRLVGELLDLVVDLLQRANGGQQVLAVVGRIEDRDRMRRRCGDSQSGQAERQSGASGQKSMFQKFHLSFSSSSPHVQLSWPLARISTR